MDAIKIVTFDDGSNAITRINELRDPDGNSLCFVLNYPFSLDSRVNDDGETNVRFAPFNIYTQDTEIRIPFNAVRSITNPKTFIYEKYLEVITPFDPVYANAMRDKDPTDPAAPEAVSTTEETEE